MNTTFKVYVPEPTAKRFSRQFRRITLIACFIGSITGAAGAGGLSLSGGGVSVSIGDGSFG